MWGFEAPYSDLLLFPVCSILLATTNVSSYIEHRNLSFNYVFNVALRVSALKHIWYMKANLEPI